MIVEIARLTFTATAQTKVVPMVRAKHAVAHVINGGVAWTGGALRAYGSCSDANLTAATGIACGAGTVGQPAPKELPLIPSGIVDVLVPWPWLAIVSSGVWAGQAVVVICAEVED